MAIKEIYTIDAGHFHADGGACFGVVPKRAWSKRYSCDEDNFCKLTMRCMLIKTTDKNILVETGAGHKQKDYFKYYGIKDIIEFEEVLPTYGLTCHDITDVILTHLHFDHCGDCTHYDENKNLQLTFPNAIYWVGKPQWENFLNPNVREADSYFPENMLPVLEAGRLKLVAEETAICEGVSVKLFGGHTPGQVVVYAQHPQNTFVFVGDLIPVTANVPLAWVSAYDTFPITAMEAKKTVMDEAIANNHVLVLVHDAFHECCTVAENNGKYKVERQGMLGEFL
jgi:glyoxylase-like metal-dependent hydrolase (beta-lactamase superfamily II)